MRLPTHEEFDECVIRNNKIKKEKEANKIKDLVKKIAHILHNGIDYIYIYPYELENRINEVNHILNPHKWKLVLEDTALVDRTIPNKYKIIKISN